MACFVVPVVEAVVVAAITKSVKSKETQSTPVKADHAGEKDGSLSKTSFSRKLKWLTTMLWGGSVLLAFEHIWHGEIVPWFPFLTAASDSAGVAAMLYEMVTVGVAMSVLITAVWGLMLLIVHAVEKKAFNAEAKERC